MHTEYRAEAAPLEPAHQKLPEALEAARAWIEGKL